MFAQDKTSRTLVVAKLDHHGTNPNATVDTSKSEISDTTISEGIEIVFRDKVEYFGNTAQSIAFLKRENFARLDLKVELDIDQMLDEELASQTPGVEHTDLSSQIQVVNLGYLG